MNNTQQPISCITKLEHFAGIFVIMFLQKGYPLSEAIDEGYFSAKVFLNYENDNSISISISKQEDSIS